MLWCIIFLPLDYTSPWRLPPQADASGPIGFLSPALQRRYAPLVAAARQATPGSPATPGFRMRLSVATQRHIDARLQVRDAIGAATSGWLRGMCFSSTLSLSLSLSLYLLA